jgi:hypothetical protein
VTIPRATKGPVAQLGLASPKPTALPSPEGSLAPQTAFPRSVSSITGPVAAADRFSEGYGAVKQPEIRFPRATLPSNYKPPVLP